MVEKIIEAVGLCYGATPEQLKGFSRIGVLPEARRMVVHFIVDNELGHHAAAKAINRHRTYPYRALERMREELEIYQTVRNRQQQINQVLEQYKSNNK